MLRFIEMRRAGPLFALVTLAACTAAGDSDGDDVVVVGDALVGGGAIHGSVRVEPDRLVLSAVENDGLSIAPGRLLVGPPDRRSDTNPQGYLRKAVSTERIGSDLVVHTQPARLEDVVQSGEVRAHALLDDGAALGPSAVSVSLARGVQIENVPVMDFHTTFHDPTHLLPVQSFEIERKVTIPRGHLRFTPSLDLGIAIKHGKLDRFDAIARGDLDAEITIAVDTTTNVEIDKNPAYHDALQRFMKPPAISFNLWESEPHVLPPQWIGFVPIVETVRYRVALECDLDLVSTIHGEATFSLRSAAEFGARYRNGAWQQAESPTMDTNASFVVTRNGSLAGSCGLRAELGIYLYDLAGPALAITPYANFDVRTQGQGTTWAATPGFRGSFAVRGQVLGWELFRRDLVLFDLRRSEPFRGTFGL